MKQSLFILCFAVILSASPSHAVEIAVAENLVFEINLSAGWTLHTEPPEALVKEAASHIAHEPAAANATTAQIEKVARKRMAANEIFVYHAQSGAHLDIDFSPLEQGASAPSARTLRTSAEYAAQSLEGEDDVTGLDWAVAPTTINGAVETFLLSASYLQHEHPMTFLGYVGYARGYWFFLYFTAPGRHPAALREMQSMLGHVAIRNAER